MPSTSMSIGEAIETGVEVCASLQESCAESVEVSGPFNYDDYIRNIGSDKIATLLQAAVRNVGREGHVLVALDCIADGGQDSGELVLNIRSFFTVSDLVQAAKNASKSGVAVA